MLNILSVRRLARVLAALAAGLFSWLAVAGDAPPLASFSGELAAGQRREHPLTLDAGEYVQGRLAGAGMRVALATTHLPLKDVAAAITHESLERTLRILHADMQRKYGVPQPRILVAGLNPHAGEGGHLGREEIEVITPVLDRLRAEGMILIGPLPADTMFTPPMLAKGDCVLAMYHDQGLTALKYATFGQGINVTLGLPIIRTSVDHGTALELAGTGKADSGSLRVAIEQAIEMVERSRALTP